MPKPFEEFLRDQHAKSYTGIDDDMLDSFENWLLGLELDDFIELGTEAMATASAKTLGSLTSKKKARTSRMNGKKGGRPIKARTNDLVALLKQAKP